MQKNIDSPIFCLHILRIYHAEDQAFPILIVVSNRQQKMNSGFETHSQRYAHAQTYSYKPFALKHLHINEQITNKKEFYPQPLLTLIILY